MTARGACWALGIRARPINATGSGYLPTPTATQFLSNQGGSGGRVGKVRLTLAGMAEKGMFPTPTAHNAKEMAAPSEYKRNTPTLAAQVGGKLNPRWTEWLMGFPVGWTSCEPLAMHKFRKWLRSHLES